MFAFTGKECSMDMLQANVLRGKVENSKTQNKREYTNSAVTVY